jgi:hypothetical protein
MRARIYWKSAKEMAVAALLIPAWTICVVLFIAVAIGAPLLLISLFTMPVWLTFAVASMPIMVPALAYSLVIAQRLRRGRPTRPWV